MAQKRLASDTTFNTFVGRFYLIWSAVEGLTCILIGDLLKLQDEETHLLTARMEFSRKVGLIRELLKRHPHPKDSEIRVALGKLQNNSKRNVFAHGIAYSDATTVSFLERNWQQHYVSSTHTFTMAEFAKHCSEFASAADELSTALGYQQPRVWEFIKAADRAQSKARKSPNEPNDKA